jgi:hypothetical protein
MPININSKGTGIFDRVEVLGLNKTGGALTVGGVYALDVSRINGASVDQDTALSDVVATAAGNLRGFLVVALAATANNTVGRFLLKGFDKVLLDGTTAIAAGDRLIPAAASINLIQQPATSLFVPCGFAVNAQGSAGAVLTAAYFDGETWKCEKAAS